MSLPPPLPPGQRKTDLEQVDLLSIFYFVLGGLSIVGLGFLVLHYFVMAALLDNPEIWKDAKGGPPPRQILVIFQWFYGIFGVLWVVSGALNIACGFCLRARKARVFCLIVAALELLSVPLGTVLGIFTIIVLSRASVRELFAPPRSAPPAR